MSAKRPTSDQADQRPSTHAPGSAADASDAAPTLTPVHTGQQAARAPPHATTGAKTTAGTTTSRGSANTADGRSGAGAADADVNPAGVPPFPSETALVSAHDPQQRKDQLGSTQSLEGSEYLQQGVSTRPSEYTGRITAPAPATTAGSPGEHVAAAAVTGNEQAGAQRVSGEPVRAAVAVRADGADTSADEQDLSTLSWVIIAGGVALYASIIAIFLVGKS